MRAVLGTSLDNKLHFICNIESLNILRDVQATVKLIAVTDTALEKMRILQMS